MDDHQGTPSFFGAIAGVFLIIEGVWGIASPMVFGILSTNLLHACIHIALGIAGLVCATRGGARGYCIFLGILLLFVGICWFVPGVNVWLVGYLNVNFAVAILNILVGVVALVAAMMAPKVHVREVP